MTLINKILIGMGCAVAAVFLSILVWLKMSNLHLQAEVAEAQVQLVAFRMANDSLAGEIKKQNMAFESLRAESEKQKHLAETAAIEAKRKAQRFLDEAEDLRRMKASGDACAAANSLFNAYLEGK